ncbi:MAG: dihydroorotase [Nitrospirota bacterium]|jgi:dihydroorotase
MKLLVRGGHVVDPSQGMDGPADVLVENGRVLKVAPRLEEPRGNGDRVLEAQGMYVLPGLVDMHTHLREPGFEHKETIETGTGAAIRGGFTSVCPMPNTLPVHDNAGITEYILQKAQTEGACSVFPIGAVTKGQKGAELAEMGLMKEGGCVAFSDDGFPVESALIMRRALEYSRTVDVPIVSHCEDLALSREGVMNEGLLAHSMGLGGIPAAAEETMVYRDLALAELTRGRLHIAHVSTEGSVRLIREAKSRGICVTAETCPHYFSLTEEAVRGFDTNAKVNPPLRRAQDVEAVKEGLRDGTLDAIATDHAPHHRNEKGREFDQAPSGIAGLETALPLALGLVDEGVLTLAGLVEKMALTPARILGLSKGTLAEGADADLVVLDPGAEFTVNAEAFLSRGKNTPFDGHTLKGRVVAAISMGRVHTWR